MACGEVGLTLDYFYSITPREFANILKGFRRKQELNIKTSWEQTRRILHAILIQYQPTNKQGKFKKPFNLKDAIAFPWEDLEPNAPKPMDSDTTEKSKAFWRNRDELKKQST